MPLVKPDVLPTMCITLLNTACTHILSVVQVIINWQQNKVVSEEGCWTERGRSGLKTQVILVDESCRVLQSFVRPPEDVASHHVLGVQAMSIQQPQLRILTPMGTDCHLQQQNAVSRRTLKGHEVCSCLARRCTCSEPYTDQQAPAGS